MLPGGVGQLDRPAVERDRRRDHVARRAGGRRDDAALVAGQGVDEAALADVRRAGDHDLPRLDEVTTHADMGQRTSEVSQ
jgi:hypothetical protein